MLQIIFLSFLYVHDKCSVPAQIVVYLSIHLVDFEDFASDNYVTRLNHISIFVAFGFDIPFFSVT